MASVDKSFNSRLKYVREVLGYTQSGISEVCGSKLRSWQEYEKGSRVPGSQVLEGLVHLGVNVNWVLTGQGPMLSKDAALPERPQAAPAHSLDNFVFINVLQLDDSSELALANLSQDPAGLAFQRDWLEKEQLNIDQLVVVQARGDSMQPTVMNGDNLLVETLSTQQEAVMEPEAQPIDIDGLYVLKATGHVVVKRLQLDMQGGLFIKSDNPAYKDIHITKASMSEVTIIGKVRWVGRSFL